jgi:hypothetical protein
MDQSGRFILERSECRFPAIGIWMRCGNVNDVSVGLRICEFLRRRVSKGFLKYMLTVNEKNCICFAKIVANGPPELFTVEWRGGGWSGTEGSVVEYGVMSGRDTVVELKQQNLEFTLRCQESGGSTEKKKKFSSPKKDNCNVEEL